MTKRTKNERAVCLRLRPEEYTHLQMLAAQCGDSCSGVVRRLVRLARVARPIAVQQPELVLVASDQEVARALRD